MAASVPGLTDCGAAGDDNCCTSLEVPGGLYDRTYLSDTGGIAYDLADPARVSGFQLDKYVVTVGRFRQFVNAWSNPPNGVPTAGAGKHAHLNGGKGLVDVGDDAGVAYETGWDMAWDSNVAPLTGNLTCGPFDTWTATAGNQETLPIDCVNWYEAYAFCIWDGGFLPSEAEWEFAAAGGSEQLEYPWGATDPGTADQYAIYSCYFPPGSSSSGSCTNATLANVAPVGFATAGTGPWGQLDMGGEIIEWILDWYSTPYVDPCVDCAYSTMPPSATATQVYRGGSFTDGLAYMNPFQRASTVPANRDFSIGFRCARTP